MVNYKDLGLVNTKEMFAKAIKGGYAIPAFNFNNMEQMQAIIKAAVETKSPVILQVSKGARQYANATLLRYMAQGAVEYAKELGCPNPQIVLHLDHGDTFETCKSCIDSGFSSVMIDGSHLPYEENVALTKQVLKMKFLQATTLIPILRKLSTSLLVRAAILWLSQSVLLTVLISSLRSNVRSTLLQVRWFLLHWHSMFWTLLWRNFRDSLSFFTVLLLFLRKRLRLSTNSVAL